MGIFTVALVLAGFAAQVDLRGLSLPTPAIYDVEAYVDRAPEGMAVIETVRVSWRGRDRSLVVVSYRRLTIGDPLGLLRDVRLYDPDFVLLGPDEQIERLLAAAPGARFSGTFRHLRSDRLLVVQRIEFSG